VGPLSPRHGASLGCGRREVFWVRRVAANILNKQSLTADKKWSSSLGLDIESTNPHLKNISTVTKCFKVPRTWTDSLVRTMHWKNDMRFDTWNVRSLYRVGAMKSVVGELEKYKLDLVGVQEVRWEGERSKSRQLYIFLWKTER
jgi:hypothetical protein